MAPSKTSAAEGEPLQSYDRMASRHAYGRAHDVCCVSSGERVTNSGRYSLHDGTQTMAELLLDSASKGRTPVEIEGKMQSQSDATAGQRRSAD
jgi:hypothetical protein